MESDTVSGSSLNDGNPEQRSNSEISQADDLSSITESERLSTTSSQEGISERSSVPEQLSVSEDTSKTSKLPDVKELKSTSSEKISEAVFGDQSRAGMTVSDDTTGVGKENEPEKIMIRLRRFARAINIGENIDATKQETEEGIVISDPDTESLQFFAGPRYVSFYPVDLPMVPAVLDESGHALRNWFVVSLEQLTKTRPISVSIADEDEQTEDKPVPDTLDLQYSDPCYVPFYAFNFTKVPMKSSEKISDWNVVPLNTLSYSVKPQTPSILITTVADPDPDENRLFQIQRKFPIFDDGSHGESIPAEDRANVEKFAKYSEPLYVPFYPARLPLLPVREIGTQKLTWYVVSFDSILQLDESTDASTALKSKLNVHSVDSASPTLVYKDPLLVPIYKTRLPNYPAKEDKFLRQLNEWNAMPMSIFKRFFANTTESEFLVSPENSPPVEFIGSPKDTDTTRYKLKRSSSLIEGPNSPKQLREAVEVEKRPLTNIERAFQNYQNFHYVAFSEVSNKLLKIKSFMREATSDHLYAAREDHGDLLNILFEFESQSAKFDPMRRNLGLRLEKFNSFMDGIDALFTDMYTTGNSHAKTLCTIMGVAVKLLVPENLATQAKDFSVLEVVLSDESNEETPEAKLPSPVKQLLDRGEIFIQWNMAYNAKFKLMLINLKDLVADAAKQCSPILHPLKGSSDKEHQTRLIISALNKMLKAIKEAKEDIENYCIGYELSFSEQSVAILKELSALSSIKE